MVRIVMVESIWVPERTGSSLSPLRCTQPSDRTTTAHAGVKAHPRLHRLRVRRKNLVRSLHGTARSPAGFRARMIFVARVEPGMGRWPRRPIPGMHPGYELEPRHLPRISATSAPAPSWIRAGRVWRRPDPLRPAGVSVGAHHDQSRSCPAAREDGSATPMSVVSTACRRRRPCHISHWCKASRRGRSDGVAADTGSSQLTTAPRLARRSIGQCVGHGRAASRLSSHATMTFVPKCRNARVGRISGRRAL